MAGESCEHPVVTVFGGLCTAQIGRICGIGRRRESAWFYCPRKATAFYVCDRDGRQTRYGRCAEHDNVDLSNPKNAGWKKEAPDGDRSA
jgi:hypothetical protein